jgi:outer membrane protein assembly factor BamB
MHLRSLLAVLLLAQAAVAADWPQYAGPTRNNVSPETELLKQWPEGGPKVLWSTALGEGFGGAAIAGSEVFVLDRPASGPEGKDSLRCFDLASGKELWSYTYDAPGKTSYNGSRAVPAVTAQHVFSVGPFGHFICLDRKTHQPVWQTQVIAAGVKLPPWAIAKSPLVYKDSVIVGTVEKNAGITAYEQATGKVLWKSETAHTAYSSPVLLEVGGQLQLVMTLENAIVGVSPDTGKQLWSFGAWKCNIPIPHPVSMGGGRLFVSAGYKAGSVMIEVSGSEVKELWRIAPGSQVHQPLVAGDAIYFNGTTNSTPREGIVCVDIASGEILWKSGAQPALQHNNLIAAAGVFYLLDASGSLNIVEPSREALKVVASAKLLGGRDIWAPMALSNGKLIIRDQSELKCLDISGR